MIDLALGKKATQSSLLPHIFSSIEENAQNAVNPDNHDANFHTKSEWFPWWQVDLSEYCEITKIVLRNTHFHQERAKQFTILISLDGKEWTECYSKVNHSVFGLEDDLYTAKFITPFNGRYVRIRMDSWGEFHLRNVHIYGTPCVNQNIEALSRQNINIPNDINVVFAVNFNEEDTYLPVYINNFLNYTQENCHLIINFPEGRSIPTELLPQSNRVHIFNGKIKRYKWGGTLILGHMESYGYALSILGKIDYFCTCATNSLFLKSFNLKKTIQQIPLKLQAPVGMARSFEIDTPLARLPTDGHAMWIWNNLRNHTALVAYLKEKLDIDLFSLAQIEGLFASGEEWNTMYSRMDQLIECNNYITTPQFDTPALEEFLPITFFNKFGTGLFTNICYMLWEPLRELSFYDLIQLEQHLPEHMCQSKWFARAMDFAPLAALNQEWSRNLLESLRNDHSVTNYNHFTTWGLTGEYFNNLSYDHNYHPITRQWPNHSPWERTQWQINTLLPEHEKTVIKPALQNISIDKQFPTIWLETTNDIHNDHNIYYEAILEEDGGSSFLHINSFATGKAAGRHGYDYTRAVLFISPMIKEHAHIIRISIRKPYNLYDSLLHNIRFSDGHSNIPWRFITHKNEGDVCHYYYIRPKESISDNIWVGIPSFPNTSITLEISVGRYSH